MRFITTKALYRAFPELDHFSDEQCLTFVNAAKRGVAPRLARELLQLLPAIFAIFFVGWTCVVLTNSIAPPSRDQPDLLFFALASVVMLISFGSAALAYLVTRDLLLRRRIRWVMNARGSCYECSYGLTGLLIVKTPTPDGTTDAVICPECGTPHKADATIGEVVPDEKGTLRYVPSPDARAEARPSRTARKLRSLIKPALYTLAGLLVFVLLIAGGYEAFLRHQASRANADRVTIAQLDDVLLEVFPHLPPPEQVPRPFPFKLAEAIVARTDAAGLAAFPPQFGNDVRLDFDLIAPAIEHPLGPDYPPDTLARNTAQATTVFDALISSGLGTDLDALGSIPPLRPFARLQQLADGTTTVTLQHSYASFRVPLTLNRARMRLAMKETKPEALVQTLATHLGLLKHIAHVPEGRAATLARYEHGLAIDLAVRAIHRHRNREWLDGVKSALAKEPYFATNTEIDRFYDLSFRHTIAEIFADPSNVRLGTFSPYFSDLESAYPYAHVGTYSGSLTEYEAIRAHWQPLIAQEPFQRATTVPPPVMHAAVIWAGSGQPWWLRVSDHSIAVTRAIPLFLAIERYLLDNNRLPETLEALIPKYLDTLPIDPFSGKPLLFKPSIDQTNPDQRRSYSIYSTGPDQVDSGGAFGIAPYQGFNINATSNDIRLITMPPPR